MDQTVSSIPLVQAMWNSFITVHEEYEYNASDNRVIAYCQYQMYQHMPQLIALNNLISNSIDKRTEGAINITEIARQQSTTTDPLELIGLTDSQQRSTVKQSEYLSDVALWQTQVANILEPIFEQVKRRYFISIYEPNKTS